MTYKPGDIIETAPGECDEIVGPEGNTIKLGLTQIPPAGEPKVFALLRDSEYEILSEQEIKRRLSDTSRVRARDWWGPETVKDQDGRGACQGYASAGCMERARHLAGQDYIPLSGDFAYSLVSDGVDRGSGLGEGFRAAKQYGYCPEDTPGLVRWEYRKNRMPQAAFEAAKRFIGHEGYIATTEQELLSGLVQNMIAVVAVHVAGAYSRLDQYGYSRGGNGVGNHAVCVDDAFYDTRVGAFAFDSPNSWKTSWGDNGRCLYKWSQHFARTHQVHSFYLIPATIQDPEGDNPPVPKE